MSTPAGGADRSRPFPTIKGRRKELIGALKAMRVRLVRWPDGCFAGEYHWREGIGPRDQHLKPKQRGIGSLADVTDRAPVRGEAPAAHSPQPQLRQQHARHWLGAPRRLQYHLRQVRSAGRSAFRMRSGLEDAIQDSSFRLRVMRVNVWFMYAKITLLALLALPARAGEVEVLHYWTWGDEAKALELARASMRAKGHVWRDFPTGYGNDPAILALGERIKAGSPPAAAQILPAHAIQQWASTGALADLDVLAKAGKWDAVLPMPVRSLLKNEGRYVAAPVYLHRNDWLWINVDILQRAGAKTPQTWEQFFETAEAMKRSGFVALAHGGQPWQNLHLFETVVLGTAGLDFYRKALLTLDPRALGSVDMERALHTFRRLRHYTAQGARARDWNEVSDELAQGKAGMQVMGGWAMPLFAQAERKSGLRYACVPAPGVGRAYLFALDSFVMFKQNDPGKRKGQADFAAALLSPQLQQGMNLIRSSVPPRLGVDLSQFDRCARQSGAAYAAAAAAGTLVPSTGLSVAPRVVQAWSSILDDYWHDQRMTPRMAMDRMKAAARSAQ